MGERERESVSLPESPRKLKNQNQESTLIPRNRTRDLNPKTLNPTPSTELSLSLEIKEENQISFFKRICSPKFGSSVYYVLETWHWVPAMTPSESKGEPGR